MHFANCAGSQIVCNIYIAKMPQQSTNSHSNKTVTIIKQIVTTTIITI